MPTSKGFLIRGTLRPQMGSVGVSRNPAASMSGRHVPNIPPRNRVPSSITVKRNIGQRG